ncbi:MAG: HlyD family efflux transporter periplasmic adaptor subunit [Planctomycetota bacterium]
MKKLFYAILKLGFALAVLAFVAGLAVHTYRSLMPPEEDREGRFLVNTYTVERGAMGEEMKIKGTVSGEKAEKIKPPRLRGTRCKITYVVPEGTPVEKGDVLARFDEADLRMRIEETERKISKVKADQFATQVEIEILEDAGDGQVRKSRFDWQTAEKELEMYREAELPLETRRKRLRVDEAETDFKRAETKHKHMPDLLDKDYVTLDRKREAKITLKKCEMALDRARSDLDVFLKYSNPLTLFRKTSNLTKAEKEYKTSESRIEKQLKNLNAALLQHKAELSRLEKNIAEYKDDLKKMVMESPTKGVVIYGDKDQPWMQARARQRMHVGQTVHRWLTMFTIPDTSKFKVTMKINEADIPNFKVDMAALVDIESAGLKDVPGKITKIPEVTAKGDWRTSTKVKEFEVEVTLEREKLDLRSGITAEVRVMLAELEDVIKVPLHAVRKVKGKRFVYLVKEEEEEGEGERLMRTMIEVGQKALSFAEVKTGLKEGDRVFLGVPPVALLKAEEALAMEAGDPKAQEKGEAGGEEKGKMEVPPGGGLPEGLEKLEGFEVK